MLIIATYLSPSLFFSLSLSLSGKSTYYNDYPGGGACALDPVSPLNKQPDWMLVAAGKGDYQESLGCGMCIEIKANGEQATDASGGPTPMKGTYKATIWDLCEGCKQGTAVISLL